MSPLSDDRTIRTAIDKNNTTFKLPPYAKSRSEFHELHAQQMPAGSLVLMKFSWKSRNGCNEGKVGTCPRPLFALSFTCATYLPDPVA